MSNDPNIRFRLESESGELRVIAPTYRRKPTGKLEFAVWDSEAATWNVESLAPADVNRLHTALGAWMAENGITARSAITPVPVYPADSMYGQLIRKAVAEEVARVLPLHQAPMAAVGIDCPEPVRPEQLLADVHRDCGFVWALHRRTEPDPEPHDVGHPVYEDARPHPVNTDPAPGFLGATLPVGTSHCPECDHGWNDHTAKFCWGSRGCRCSAERPAPVPVTESDKVWGETGAPPVACTCSPTVLHRHGTDGCLHPNCTCKWGWE